MNQMKKFSLAILLILSMTLGLAAPAFASANKGVRVKAEVPAFKEGEDQNASIFFGATQKVKCKATTKMKISCKVYLPVSALTEGSVFTIDPMVGLGTSKKYLGTVYSIGNFAVQVRKEKGKITFYKVNDKGETAKLPKKYASVKKKNGFYVISVKKIPLCKWAFKGIPDYKTKIYTKKALYLESYIRVELNTPKDWTGYIFMDDMTLYAKKTLTMKFNKKDYKDVFAYRLDGKKVTASVKKIKK